MHGKVPAPSKAAAKPKAAFPAPQEEEVKEENHPSTGSFNKKTKATELKSSSQANVPEAQPEPEAKPAGGRLAQFHKQMEEPKPEKELSEDQDLKSIFGKFIKDETSDPNYIDYDDFDENVEEKLDEEEIKMSEDMLDGPEDRVR